MNSNELSRLGYLQSVQLRQHKLSLEQVGKDLSEHTSYPPEKGAKPRIIQDYIEKENYLNYEVCCGRYS